MHECLGVSLQEILIEGVNVVLKAKKVKSVFNLKKLLKVYLLFWSLKTLAAFANCTCKSFIKLTPVSYTFINFITSLYS